jgi:hypothetical protein
LAYVQQRKSDKGTRYRGFYKGTDGRYRSAGTYDTNERALEVAEEAERHAAEQARHARRQSGFSAAT